MDDDEDDSEDVPGLFENGHWIWGNETNSLEFVRDAIPLPVETAVKTSSTVIKFRDDIDPLEQAMFRKKFYRKVTEGKPDVIILQDIKDVVIFTAPISILNFSILKTLHSLTCERFIRSLIVYAQYYMQMCRIMKKRATEASQKIRIPESERVEERLAQNMADFRTLIAKEYLFINADDKGNTRNVFTSLTAEARATESLLVISIQIVWIALGRPNISLIETEINRIFRTNRFNLSLHQSNTKETPPLDKYEQAVLWGAGECKDNIATLKSPVVHDMLHNADYRTTSLGVAGHIVDRTSERIEQLQNAFYAPEEELPKLGISLGILGQPRANYDMMLVQVKNSKELSSASQASNFSIKESRSQTSRKSSRKSLLAQGVPFPPDAVTCSIPDKFPELLPHYKQRKIDFAQRTRWMKYLEKMTQPKKN